jgi:hypothetical protein
MKLTSRCFVAAVVPLFASVVAVSAAITTIVDSSTDPAASLPSALLSTNLFNSGVQCIRDRSHCAKPADFQTDGRLSLPPSAPAFTAAFPPYLEGQQFVYFKQGTRAWTNYTATISVDQDSTAYLLVDNRLSDGAINSFSPFDDPVFGTNVLVYTNAVGNHCVDPPTLADFPLTEWVLDDGWTRVNTGLSPNYKNPGYCINDLVQGDYLGIDESCDGGLNQFYAVYAKIIPAGGSVSVRQQAYGNNMFCLVVSTNTPRAIQATVNSTANTDIANAELTLIEAINWMNSPGYRALDPAESNQVATVAGTINRIKFAIPGAGPHFISSPASSASGALFPLITASDLVVDGYSQSEATPNTNPILAANNAVIKIIIDTRTTSNPDKDPVFGVTGNNVFLRGLSLLGGEDAIDFGGGAVGGGIQGCWIGVSPDQSIVVGPVIGSYVYDSGGSQVFGTDGDRFNDRNEFNVWVGCKEMAIGIENDVSLTTTNCRISGNFIGVMPDGMHAAPAAAIELITEGDGVEIAGAHGTIIGIDSSGVYSHDDERNVFGGLTVGPNPSANHEVIQIWSATENLKIMGNYMGVGIDGVTALPNLRGIVVDDAPTTIQIGGNGDGVRDALEANIIANCTDSRVFKFAGPTTSLYFRRNSFFGNTPTIFSDPQNSFNGSILASGDYAVISPVISNVTTRTELVGWVPVSHDPTADNRGFAEIHIYEADPAAAADRPQGKKWLATYLDNGPQDLDSRTNYFRFNICNLPISSTGANLTVNETCTNDLAGGSSPFATAYSLPNVANTLSIAPSGGSVTLSWQMNGVLQARPNLASGIWTNVPGCSPVVLPAGSGSLYFRVAQ